MPSDTFLFIVVSLITKTIRSSLRIELPSSVPAEGCRAGSKGSSPPAKDLPRRAVAWAAVQDVLCCLVLQAAGAGWRD